MEWHYNTKEQAHELGAKPELRVATNKGEIHLTYTHGPLVPHTPFAEAEDKYDEDMHNSLSPHATYDIKLNRTGMTVSKLTSTGRQIVFRKKHANERKALAHVIESLIFTYHNDHPNWSAANKLFSQAMSKLRGVKK